MNTPTLKELCAKATPGPYKVETFTGFEREETVIVADKVVVASINEQYPNTEANALLHARLSPETVLRVYEALTNADAALRHWSFTSVSTGHYLQLEQAKEGLRAAIRLLDGQPTEDVKP